MGKLQTLKKNGDTRKTYSTLTLSLRPQVEGLGLGKILH